MPCKFTRGFHAGQWRQRRRVFLFVPHFQSLLSYTCLNCLVFFRSVFFVLIQWYNLFCNNFKRKKIPVFFSLDNFFCRDTGMDHSWCRLFEEYSYIRGSLQSISTIFSFIPTIIVIQTLLYIYILYFSTLVSQCLRTQFPTLYIYLFPPQRKYIFCFREEINAGSNPALSSVCV
jgi:hypothetical protein